MTLFFAVCFLFLFFRDLALSLYHQKVTLLNIMFKLWNTAATLPPPKQTKLKIFEKTNLKVFEKQYLSQHVCGFMKSINPL